MIFMSLLRESKVEIILILRKKNIKSVILAVYYGNSTSGWWLLILKYTKAISTMVFFSTRNISVLCTSIRKIGIESANNKETYVRY